MLVEVNPHAASASVTGAIQKAARLTGTSFQYLLATARVESNLNPHAAAKTSSAGGLFQFIEQTWLGTLKEAGPSLGYGRYADAISRTRSGRFVVNDPQLRAQVMSLRQDPTANALMAGAFTQSNAATLSRKLGRAPSDGELYIAHFLGANGAAKLIQSNPSAQAADAFPGAARANRSIFFDRHGRARNAAEVSAVLANKFQVAAARRVPAASTPIAQAAPSVAAMQETASPQSMEVVYSTQGTERVRPVITIRPANSAVAGMPPETANVRVTRAYEALTLPAFLPFVAPTAPPPATATATATATAPAPAPVQVAPVAAMEKIAAAQLENEPTFHNPYRASERRRAAIAPEVNDLWAQAAGNVARVRAMQAGRAAPVQPVHPVQPVQQPAAVAEAPVTRPRVAAFTPTRTSEPLGLFQDHRPNVRALFRG